MIRMNRKMSACISVAAVSALALAACSDQDQEPDADQEPEAGQTVEAPSDSFGNEESSTDAAEEVEEESVDPEAREQQEAAGPQPRLAVTYDGGVQILDGSTLEALADFEQDGFLRVNAAGDGRHFFLSQGSGFQLIDGGTWAEPHGDHDHFYTTQPYMGEVGVDGPEPGHVVAHDGVGALFFDGNGEIHSFDLNELDVAEELTTNVAETEEAHHGVAAVNQDGSRFETLSDRSGARFLDDDGEEVARSQECPGVHGEASLPDGGIAVGCEDGVLVFDGENFTKIAADEDYARIGNLFGAADSPVLLGDYNTDEDGGPMDTIALVNTETEEIVLSEVGSAYNFRSLARGPQGEALVLAEDGELRVIDPETGDQIDSLDVMDSWGEPEDWQQSSPRIVVDGSIAYISEPESQSIHMVDLEEMEIFHSAELEVAPNEMAVASGRA